jgi:membrane protein
MARDDNGEALNVEIEGMLVGESDHPGQKDQVKTSEAEKSAGASATGPSQIPPKGWLHVLKRAGVGFMGDRISAEGASVTFFALLALFPAIAAFISIYGLFNDPASLVKQLDNLGGIVPGGGIDLIKGQISALTAKGHKELGFAAIVGLGISLWSANSGMKSLFDALNVVYHEQEKRSYVRRTLISFAFTIGAIAFVIVALAVVVAVPLLLKFIGLASITAVLLAVGRWPAMLILVGFALAVTYRYGPSRNKARWQWVSWGGLAASIVWIIMSLLFSFYVSNFGTYNKTYGSLGAVVGFMTWIWISSVVVLMGAELNAELEQQTDRDSTVGPEKPEGARGAFKADVKS